MANSRLCSIPDCGKKHYAKGVCHAHYQRRNKYGDPLGGGTSRGEPIRFIRDIALQTKGFECLAWPFYTTKDGYGRAFLDGRATLVHRYICGQVNGSPPEPEYEAAHSCGNRICVNPHHLSWKTHAGNMADRFLHGTHNRGSRNGISKLTESQAREILALKGTASHREIGLLFGVSRSAVWNIHSGRLWGWL